MFYFKVNNYLIMTSIDLTHYQYLMVNKLTQNEFDECVNELKYKLLVHPNFEQIQKLCSLNSINELELV